MGHRQMQRGHATLIVDTGYPGKKCISYSQLKRVLRGLDHTAFNQINSPYFGKGVAQMEDLWYAIDGKGLRGGIDKAKGEKRGENVVCMVTHQSLEGEVIGYYDGAKGSEKKVVRSYFDAQQVLTGPYSVNALHCGSALMEIIESKKGTYLVQVKGNQAKLLEDCKHIAKYLKAKETFGEQEKGHGRIENRQALLYDLPTACLDKRWANSGIKCLVVIKRERYRVKTGEKSEQTAFYVSNQALEGQAGQGLFRAVRFHWGVEPNNWVRDKQLGEDDIKCKGNEVKTIAAFINVALNLLRKQNINHNISQLREELIYDRHKIYTLFDRNIFL